MPKWLWNTHGKGGLTSPTSLNKTKAQFIFTSFLRKLTKSGILLAINEIDILHIVLKTVNILKTLNVWCSKLPKLKKWEYKT